MTRTRRWIGGAAVAAVLVFGGLALLVVKLLPTDAEMASELGARFEKSTGIGLRVGAVHWSLRPSPVVVLGDLSTGQERPITVRRIVLRPRLAELLKRKIAIDAVEVEDAVLPRESVRAFRGRWRNEGAAPMPGGGWSMAEVPVQRVRLRGIVWIDRRDISLAYDADVQFDRGWRPREAEVWRPGASPAARLRIERQSNQDRWRTLIDVGGGTWNGETEIESLDQGRWRLASRLEPKGVDLVGLVRAFGRKSAIEGTLDGRTVVDAEGDNLAELVRRLHTRTRFTVHPARLDGFDLARAVGTAGIVRGGQTLLDELTGTLDTQTTPDGVVLRYTNVQARSGLLTASGSATVLNRKLNGEASVDIVDGVVGMPLKLAGTLDEPTLSLTGGALTGAAVGSAVLPGLGTAIGARIGQRMEKLFGEDDPKDKPRQAPRPKPR